MCEEMKRFLKLLPIVFALTLAVLVFSVTAAAESEKSVNVGFYDEEGNLLATIDAAPGETVVPPEDMRAVYVEHWLDYIPLEWNESLTVPKDVSEYRITEKTSGEKRIVSAAELLFNIKLATHFQYNLYVPKPAEGITVTNVVLSEDRTSNYNSNLSKYYSVNGDLYNMTSVWPGMIKAATVNIPISVTFTYDGVTYTTSSEMNLRKYCNYILDNDYGERAKVLCVNVANYVYRGAILLGSTTAETAMADIVEGNRDRIIEPRISDIVKIDTSSLAPYVKNVQLVAASYGPKFRFNLTEAGKASTVTLSTGGSSNYAMTGYIETNNTFVSLINSTTVKVTTAGGETFSLKYTLANYIEALCLDSYGRVSAENALIYDFLSAMYGYATATYADVEKGHNFVAKVVPPTCESKGYTVYSCTDSDCEYFYTDNYTPALGGEHDLVYHGAKEPSCTEVGYASYFTCTKCPFTNYREVGGAHNYEVCTVLAPTCTEEGYTEYSCELCGDSYKESYLNPTGHTMGNWFVSEEISAQSDGEQRRNCLNCSHYELREIEIIDSGNFGKGTTPTDAVTYKIFADGTMKVSGTGATFGCGWNGANQPFKAYRESVKRLIICEGVTETTGGDFVGLVNLETVEFPESFTRIGTNAFMDSFKKGITSLTIPAQITYIGTYAFGVYSMDSAVFTEITVENPNLEFYSTSASNIPRIFNRGNYNSSITFYSYGASSTTAAYAGTIGAAYVNLYDSVSGEDENISYEFFLGKLTVSATDTLTALTDSAPWLDYISRSDVLELVIGEGIVEIGQDFFADYTSLTSVKISEGVTNIGDGAFKTGEKCDTPLTVSFPETLALLGTGIFAGRSGVSVSAFANTAAENLSETGVTVNLVKTFRLLMIGNSLSLDGADCTSGGTASRLYDIIKSMLGENSYVEIGVLYSGARTCTWHATMARDDVAAYQFNVISDDTDGLWRVVSNAYSAKDGLLYADWDYVTLQPYGNETLSGVDDTTTGISNSYKDSYFGTLEVSLPYLLDFIYDYAPDSEAYYYLTWASSSSAYMNTGESKFAGMVEVALTASQYSGANKSFSGIIAAGTSVQNARSTYLALLNYTDSGSLDVQKNIQRDAVHLSRSVGRYIAALTIAQTLVPESMREDDYLLPGVRPSEVIGELPAEYTEIAKLAVANTMLSANKTDSTRYMPIAIDGYVTDPVDTAVSKISALSLSGITASSEADLEAKLTALIASAVSNSDIKCTVEITAFDTQSNTFSAKVTVAHGYAERTVELSK